MIVRMTDLCHRCKHFDIGNYECKAGEYIEDMNSDEIVAECDNYDYVEYEEE